MAEEAWVAAAGALAALEKAVALEVERRAAETQAAAAEAVAYLVAGAPQHSDPGCR